MASEADSSGSSDSGGEQPRAAAPTRRARVRREGHGPRSRPMLALLGRAALRMASWPPYSVIYRIGGWLGLAQFHLPGSSRDATRVNLKLCLPELDDAQRRALERASLIETGRTMFELGAIWRWEHERLLGLVCEVDGVGLFEAARDAGRGMILLVPHLGSWELCLHYVSCKLPITALYRPPNVLEMDSVYTKCRERFGAKMARADAVGVRTLHRALHDRQAIGILPDQDPGRGSGVFVPFFGIPANTSVLVARFGAKLHPSILCMWAERLPRAQGFRIHFERTSDELANPNVELATAALNREVEHLVRRLPEQYLWSYKRFRHRPHGAPNPYKAREADDD
jgi:KDO2-lipid IV(A) lauroyltransferase